jgi:hypothetical protein
MASADREQATGVFDGVAEGLNFISDARVRNSETLDASRRAHGVTLERIGIRPLNAANMASSFNAARASKRPCGNPAAVL